MKKILLSIAVISLGLFQGCKKDTLHPTPATDVGLRISNSTPWQFTECTVDLPSVGANLADPAPHDYGQVNVNAKTDYRIFPGVYHYAYIRVVMNNKTYILQPYDFVGESPVPNGRYTYKLTYVAASDGLNLQFITD